MEPNFGLDAAPTRTPTTEALYAKRVARLCNVADPLACTPMQLREGIHHYLACERLYAPSTRGQYRAALAFVLARRVARNPHSPTLREARASLRAYPRPTNRAPVARTSAREAKAVAYSDYRIVVDEASKSRADPVTIVLVAMLRFGPELGLRPSEWQSLRVLPDGTIEVACAKNSNGRAVSSRRSLRGLHASTRFMLIEAVAAVAAAVRHYGNWDRLYDVLRSRLRTSGATLAVRGH